MTKKFFAAFVVAALTLTACKKETTAVADNNTETEVEATLVEGTSFAVQPAKSTINWEGGKVSGDKHLGTINVQEGNLVMNEGKFVGGTFVIDMNSIVVTDLADDPEMKERLEGHLKGLGDDAERQDHFFNVSNYPTATLEITSVTEENGQQMAEGNFTLKGKTNPVKFPVTVTETEDTVTLTANNFAINRTLWGVNYNSGSVVKDLAADKVIKDDILLNATVVAKK